MLFTADLQHGTNVIISMNNLVTIIAGEPNSINSEIIAKAWKKKEKIKNMLLIGNYSLLRKQILKLNIKIPTVKIKKFTLEGSKKTLCA